MAYDKIKVPAGDKITIDGSGKLQVSDKPIIGFIEGDGIGPDITAASMHIWNSAVKKAYNGKREIAWMELFAGEKANAVYEKTVWLPDETVEAVSEYLIAKFSYIIKCKFMKLCCIYKSIVANFCYKRSG